MRPNGGGKPTPGMSHVRWPAAHAFCFVDADDEVAPGYLSATALALVDHDLISARFDSDHLNIGWVRAIAAHPGRRRPNGIRVLAVRRRWRSWVSPGAPSKPWGGSTSAFPPVMRTSTSAGGHSSPGSFCPLSLTPRYGSASAARSRECSAKADGTVRGGPALPTL